MQKVHYYINEQYPQEMEENRRKLFPILRQYKKVKTNKCSIVRDKLTVNGWVYNLETDQFDQPYRIRPAIL